MHQRCELALRGTQGATAPLSSVAVLCSRLWKALVMLSMYSHDIENPKRGDVIRPIWIQIMELWLERWLSE